MPKRKKVLLTGASGSMGGEAFKELMVRWRKFSPVLLLLPNKYEKRLFKKYEGGKSLPVGKTGVVEHEGMKIVWGDLTNYDDVYEAVKGVDFVLHPAAIIPPAADHNPELAEKVNVGSVKNLITAIKEQPNNGDDIRFVAVSSIAIYGDRLPPIHRIRVGDPIKPSVYDFYALTKVKVEREIIESGLKYWAILRQTFIAIPNALDLMDPIMFHQPINTCLEMISKEDAGYGLIECLNCPDEFYGKVYNMSGGPKCRFIYINMIKRMMKLLGMGDYKKIMDRNWFALRNFHCGFYEDSEILNEYLGHWNDTIEDYYEQVKESAPWYINLGKVVHKGLIKKLFMEKLATGNDGTLHWVKSNIKGRISAFFGSKEKWEAIPDWDANLQDINNIEGYLLDHGYDDTKKDDELTIDDAKKAAKFRGGECLSTKLVDMRTKLKWKCAFGHEFEGSPYLILRAGHWCPECAAPPWIYDKIAKKNPFLAQAYYTNHDKDENNFYDEECYKDIL
ncbi:MAG: NAD-dependent epimerase/dehydratase family protein [Candidatus Helarchaeota archaeon]